jgi:hypothetical protein
MIFTVLTLATIGIATLGTIAVFIVIQVKKLYHVSDGFQVGLIVTLVVVCLIFLFAIYASCCGGKAARGLLGTLFLLLSVLFIVFAAFVAKYHGEIGTRLKFIWDEAKYQAAKDSLENAFDCCTFNDTKPPCDKPNCLDKINQFVEGAWSGLLAAAVIMAALLFIGTIVACCYACRSEPSVEAINYGGRYHQV